MSHPPAAGRALCIFIAALVTVTTLGVSDASATLRAPRLETSCPAGYTYGEERVGPFTVEGCSQSVNPRGDERSRRKYTGTVEVNGMLIEPEAGSGDLIATVHPSDSGSLDAATLTRPARTRIVLDAQIGGRDRRFPIYSGQLELTATETLRSEQFAAPAGHEPLYTATEPVRLRRSERTSAVPGAGVVAPGGRSLHRASSVRGRTEIPVGVGSPLLGLRLARDLDDVELTDRGMEFPAALQLGVAAGLLGDAVGSADIALVDGQGLTVTNLRFRVGHIGIAGVGSIDNFRVTYSEQNDTWGGGFALDLGDLFPGLDFAATISASTGAPESMRLEVEPLNIPLGQTGIVLQAVRAGFIVDPLTLSGGAGVTAGPQVAGSSLIRADGDLTIALEPDFRFEAGGAVRILPVGSTQLATGSMKFVIDSSGFISLRSRADYRATAAGVGVSANIHGDGAYSSTSNEFNIGAGATGTLELGILGSVDVVELGAVVSSDGWGACGNVYPFVSGGVGQEWNGNLRLLLGCDLSPYRVNVAASLASASGRRLAALRSSQFTVPSGLKVLSVELTADRIGPRVRLLDPDGNVVVTTGASGRAVGDRAAWFTDAAEPRQLIFLKSPKAGRWTAQALDTDPRITRVRTAVDAEPLRGTMSVTSVGTGSRKRFLLRQLRGVYDGETLRFGIRRPGGPIVPIGRRLLVQSAGTLAAKGGGEVAMEELLRTSGRHQVVVQVFRDGIPVPGRSAVIGTFTAKQPPNARKLVVRQRGRRVELRAQAKKGARLPQAWEYRLRTKAGVVSFVPRPGRSLKLWLPPGGFRGQLSVKPIVGGAVLKGAGLKRTVHWRVSGS